MVSDVGVNLHLYIKAMMADPQFLKSLIEFDKDAITDKQVKQLKGYTSDPQFTIDIIMGISSAGAGLLKWVFAMINYNAVARTVNPKRAAVASAEKSLRMAEKDLVKTKAEVAELNGQLESLTKQFESASKEQTELKDKAETMERRLVAAEKLIAGLDSERTRWTADMQELDSRKERLLGKAVQVDSPIRLLTLG